MKSDQLAQGFIQVSLNNLEGQILIDLNRQSVTILDFKVKSFPCYKSEHLLFELCLLSSCTLLWRDCPSWSRDSPEAHGEGHGDADCPSAAHVPLQPILEQISTLQLTEDPTTAGGYTLKEAASHGETRHSQSPGRNYVPCREAHAGGFLAHGGPTLKQFIGLYSMGRICTGAVLEELQPIGRIHAGAVYEGLSPMRRLPCWRTGTVWGERSSRDEVR